MMLPKGWESLFLGDVFSFKNGLNGEKSLYGAGAKFVNVMDVFRGPRLRHREIVGEMAVSPKQLTEFAVRQGDVLFNRTSETDDEIALSTVYLDTGPAVFGGFVIRARPSGKALDQEFCVYSFQAASIRREMIRRGQGAIRSNIGQADLATVPMILPPLPEQRRIAEILSTWDRAIETVEALIANARAQKKALMQSLLTGKKRLPGFSGQWTEKSLDELFTFRRGQGLSKAAVTPDGIRPCILYGELYTRYPEVIESVVGRTNSNEGFYSKVGDVLIPASTTTTGIDLANATALLESDVLLSGDINVLRTKDIKQSAPFFAYLLTHTMKYKIASRAQGITIIHLYGSDLKPLKVLVPEPDEQHAIADVIIAADKKIGGLQSQLKAIRQEKSALMQQLLTGKRRVKVAKREAM